MTNPPDSLTGSLLRTAGRFVIFMINNIILPLKTTTFPGLAALLHLPKHNNFCFYIEHSIKKSFNRSHKRIGE